MDDASPFDRCREVLQKEMERANENPGANTNRELELLTPHAEFLDSMNRLKPEEFWDLLSFVEIHHLTMGRFAAGRRSHSRALASPENSFEPGHPCIAISQSNLAITLQHLGQLEGSRDLPRSALASDEKSFGPGHPTVAFRRSNLATVLKGSGAVGRSARSAGKDVFRFTGAIS